MTFWSFLVFHEISYHKFPAKFSAELFWETSVILLGNFRTQNLTYNSSRIGLHGSYQEGFLGT